MRLAFLIACLLLYLLSSAQNDRVVRSDVDSLRNMLDSELSTSERLEAMVRLGRKLSLQDPVAAERVVKELMELAASANDRVAKAQGHNIKGSILFYRGEYDEALVEWRQCYGIYASLDSTDARGEHSLELASALNNMGIVHKRQGNLSTALEHYYSALKIREEVGAPYPIGASYLNIGGIYKSQGDPQQALLFFLKAKQLFEEADDSYGKAAVLNNLGNIYELENDLDKAEDTYKQALRLFEEEDNLRGIGLGMNNLGIVYQKQGDLDKALAHFARAKEIREQSADKAGLASVLQKIANCHAEQGKNLMAIEGYRRSLELAEEDHMAKLMLEGHEGISKVYAKTGQFEQAYQHQQRYHQLNDSLFSPKQKANLQKIQERYTHFQDSRLQTARDELYLEQNASLTWSKRLIWALVISLLAIAALLVITFRRYRQNQVLSDKLEDRNMEVARANRSLMETQVSEGEKEELLKEIHHRVKNNLQIINSLLRFQGYKVTDPEVVKHFEECQERIMSMSLLHEQLYRKENLSMVDVSAYLKSLLEGLKESHSKTKSISIHISVLVEVFGVNTMIPLGLVVNEIASNSFKHGFVGRERGKVNLTLQQDEDGYVLTMSDDGVGIEDPDIWEDPDTLGMELIKIFSGQLDGHVQLLPGEGTAYRLHFQAQKENIRLAEH